MGLTDIGSPTDPRNQPSHVAHHQALVDAIGTQVDTAWTYPPLNPTWADYNGGTNSWWTNDRVRYKKLPGGLVKIEGFCKYIGTNPANSQDDNLIIFNLPTEYRPSHSMHFWLMTAGWETAPSGIPVNVYGTDKTVGVGRFSPGDVVSQWHSTAKIKSWLTLSGISFIVP